MRGVAAPFVLVVCIAPAASAQFGVVLSLSEERPVVSEEIRVLIRAGREQPGNTFHALRPSPKMGFLRAQRLVSLPMEIRHAQPADYGRVIGRLNAWWGGREMAPMLPRLFFVHFEGTSYVVDDDQGQLAAFLIGFHSQTDADEAYVHFVGVAPERRGEGLGRRLYERFFADALAAGRSVVRCVTSPTNEDSVAFHRALGFEVERLAKDYDGPGEDRVLFLKRLA